MSLEELEKLSLMENKMEEKKPTDQSSSLEEKKVAVDGSAKTEPINFTLTGLRLKVHFSLMQLFCKLATLTFALPGNEWMKWSNMLTNALLII